MGIRSVWLVAVSVWFRESGFGFSNLAVRFKRGSSIYSDSIHGFTEKWNPSEVDFVDLNFWNCINERFFLVSDLKPNQNKNETKPSETEIESGFGFCKSGFRFCD